MIRSNSEEMIGALWVIAGLLAFQYSDVWGYVLITKGTIDNVCAIGFAVSERLK